MKCPVVSFWVSGFGMALSSLSFNAQGCIPAFWRISMYVLLWNLLALGWSLVSVYVWRLLDELLSITIPGIRSSLMFSSFEVKPPASGFQSYSYSSLKTSLPI